MMYTSYMDLSTAQQILVVILSSTLAILLVMAIVVMALVIKLLQSLRKVANKAEHFVESAEQVGTIIKNVAGPAGAVRFARAVFEMVSSHKKSK